MLVDNITLTIKAGDGGNGAATFKRTGQTAKGGPDGGNGGDGGNIYFQGSTNVTDLKEFRYKKSIIAEPGVNGKHHNLFGKNGPDTLIYLPLGTMITDTVTGKTFEIRYTDKPLLFAHGGKGGRGNWEFRTATNQAPTYAEKGGPGEERTLHLELKLIAEIGLIGLPNAGKSSLLAVLTNATPKIGAYPFTTLEPHIGMLGTFPIADIPGLIEGASLGKGLGITFLKHIEKTRILLHCIDVTNKDPQKAYETVRQELGNFNKQLLEKPEIILLNKTDLVDDATVQKLKALFSPYGKEILTCSAFDQDRITILANHLEKLLAH